MESSTVIAFRALVMLACLIVVPLAAIFGSQFPDIVKSVLIDRLMPAKAAANESSTRPEAPPFAPAAAPAWHADGSAPPPAPTASHFQPAPHANFESGAPSDAAPFQPAIERVASWDPNDGPVRRAVGEVPSNMQPGAERQNRPAGPPQSRSAAPAANDAGTQADRFTWTQRRLREYGVTYYLLETWVNEGEHYRFICRMAVANNPAHTRNFEATDTDPLRAMGRVVEQVEAWRAGRLQ